MSCCGRIWPPIHPVPLISASNQEAEDVSSNRAWPSRVQEWSSLRKWQGWAFRRGVNVTSEPGRQPHMRVSYMQLCEGRGVLGEGGRPVRSGAVSLGIFRSTYPDISCVSPLSSYARSPFSGLCRCTQLSWAPSTRPPPPLFFRDRVEWVILLRPWHVIVVWARPFFCWVLFCFFRFSFFIPHPQLQVPALFRLPLKVKVKVHPLARWRRAVLYSVFGSVFLSWYLAWCFWELVMLLYVNVVPLFWLCHRVCGHTL